MLNPTMQMSKLRQSKPWQSDSAIEVMAMRSIAIGTRASQSQAEVPSSKGELNHLSLNRN